MGEFRRDSNARAFDRATPELVAMGTAEEGASAGSPSLPGGHLRPLCSAVNVGTSASLSSSGKVPSTESPVEYKGGNGLRPTDTKS